MHKLGYFLLLSLLLFSCQNDQSVRAVLLDGQIGSEEWADAKTVSIDDQSSLFLKEDAHYYYLAIRSNLEKPLYADLFFQLPDQLFNIHASSQLGQRTLEGSDWTDTEPVTNWGETNGWYANEVRFDRAKMRKLKEEGFEDNEYAVGYFPYDGLEFQFEKRNWPLTQALLRLEIRNMVGAEGFEHVVFPPDTERKTTTNWHKLSFSR